MVEITMPQLGESVTEGTILRWLRSVGEPIEVGDALLEVATDKVDAEVPSPVTGVITDVRVPEGATVAVGTVVAVVDGATPTVPATPPPASAPPPAHPGAGPTNPPEPSTPAPPTDPTPVPVGATRGHHASPLARRILRDAGVAPAEVTGTGRHGRITRADAEQAVARSMATTSARSDVDRPPTPAGTTPTGTEPTGTAHSGRPATAATAAATTGAASTATPTDGRSTVVPMSRIRRRTAAHMVASRATAPHALVAAEVRYDNVERVRRAHREGYRAAEGHALTYLPFIARAAVDALRSFPAANASVAGDGLELHADINLGVAVDLGYEGLVAPVIHGADDFRLRALARRVNGAAARARAGDLGPDDLAGGTFTITNSGSYGTHLVIPVLNQPQVAILSTDAVRRRPVVVHTDDGDEAIGIGSVGLLALGWDQRAFDGAYAAAFLDEVRDILETRDWEAELR